MQQQQTSLPTRTRRQRLRQTEAPSGLLVTTISIAAVLLLLGVTFAADWMRAPQITLTTTTTLLSPNGDQDRDATTITFDLSQESQVTAQVFGAGDALVRTIFSAATYPAGQNFAVWDGVGDSGALVEDGFYRLQITAQGAMRSVTRSVMLEVDTQPPALQLVNLPDGLRVRDSVLNVEGITEPGANVWMQGDPAPLVVDADGRFRLQRRLLEGENALELRAVDAAGNTSRLTRAVFLVLNPPDLVVNEPQDEFWTNQAIVTVSGEVGPDIALKINEQDVAVNADGSFTFQVLLQDGENRLRILAQDDVGNLTSMERVVHVKTRPPTVTLNVAEGEKFAASLLQLAGTTDPGATVMVNRRVVPVGANGNFETSLNLLEGVNLIEVSVRDQAGNVTTLNRRVTYAQPSPVSGVEQLTQNMGELPSFLLPILGLPLLLLIPFFVLRRRTVGVKITADQQVFMPGIPGRESTLTVYVELDRPANLSLDVLDATGKRLHTLAQNRRRGARQHRFFWDGSDGLGRTAPPGEYVLEAVATAFPNKVRAHYPFQISRVEESFLRGAAQEQQSVKG
ncbi:MAG: hypothetical protein OHK0052_21520 [Anaerolineales bacterium]